MPSVRAWKPVPLCESEDPRSNRDRTRNHLSHSSRGGGYKILANCPRKFLRDAISQVSVVQPCLATPVGSFIDGCRISSSHQRGPFHRAAMALQDCTMGVHPQAQNSSIPGIEAHPWLIRTSTASPNMDCTSPVRQDGRFRTAQMQRCITTLHQANTWHGGPCPSHSEPSRARTSSTSHSWSTIGRRLLAAIRVKNPWTRVHAFHKPSMSSSIDDLDCWWDGEGPVERSGVGAMGRAHPLSRAPWPETVRLVDVPGDGHHAHRMGTCAACQ